jgi:hypothetical protein
LLFTATALLFAVRGMRRYSAVHFVCCGILAGLAYLTRPEGALIVLATGSVLVAMQFVPAWRKSWPRALICAAALVAAATAVGSPYVLATGRVTNKPTPRRLWESAGLEEAPEHSRAIEQDRWGRPPACLARRQAGGLPHAPRSAKPKGSGIAPARNGRILRGPLIASVLAIYAPENLKDRRLWGLYAIATELTKDFHYLSMLPLLLGIWCFRNRLKTEPGAWVVLVLCFLHFLILWRVAVVVGYVSDRHVLVIVLCGVFLAAGGVFALGEKIAFLVQRPRSGRPAKSAWPADSSKLSMALLIVLLVFGLQEALKPLHANRAGHRQAGFWLAEHTSPTDPIADPFCWAHYYAGRVFWEGLTPPTPPGYIPTQYVVLEKSPSSEHSRLPTIHHAKDLAARGHVVYHWPVDKPEAEAKILVYAVHP